MSDKLWKSFERWVGDNIFNGAKRNIGSGSINSTDDGKPRFGDVIHDDYLIECKCYQKIAIFRWWNKLKEEQKQCGKIPLLIMREKGNIKDTLVVMNWKDFKDIKEKAEKYDGLCK